jgi:predicted RNA-binding Zn ribbon-like protein
VFTEPVLLPNPDEPVPVLLMNTIWADTAGVHDAISTPQQLTAWLDALSPRLPAIAAAGRRARPDKGDLAQFQRLRDALRDLAAELTDDPRPHAAHRNVTRAAREVNEASGAAPSWPRLRWTSRAAASAVPAGTRPATAALSAIAAQAVELFVVTDTTLRACLAPGCVLYFAKDHPRREWCSASCGNRARAARHYQRHHRAGRT